jgi:hypothetical protein
MSETPEPPDSTHTHDSETSTASTEAGSAAAGADSSTREAGRDVASETSAASTATAADGERKAPPAGRIALVVYVVCTIVYAIFAGDRLLTHSPDNHFAYLADSYLHGTLAVRCRPQEAARNTCPPGGGGNDWARYEGRWYVAFPSFPAVLYMPAVAIAGRDFPNRAYDVALAGIAPALLYLLLERLSREKRSRRSWRENVGFAALFAFGTVYFFSVVQGSVWFTAHMVAAALLVGMLWFALDARNPLVAGLLLGVALHTRADLMYASPWFAFEALRVYRKDGAPMTSQPDETVSGWFVRLFRGADWPKAIRASLLFAAPVALALGLTFLLNKLRFGDVSEVGYRYLQIRWRDRIDRWGLFNYHYLGRNLGIALASLPWFTRTFPFIVISLHGLALWVTTPHYLELFRLRRRPGDAYSPYLALAAAAVALSVMLYQNSGWVQFGFRFSNDFAVFLIVLLAINGRRIGKLWIGAFVVAVIVNAFGAATFDRQFRVHGQNISVYDNDNTQTRYFQPD